MCFPRGTEASLCKYALKIKSVLSLNLHLKVTEMKLITDLNVLRTETATYISGDETVKDGLWTCAVSWSHHAKETGDWTGLRDMLRDMGKRSQRRQRIAAAIRQLSSYVDPADGKTKCALSPTISKDGTVKVAIAKENSGLRQHINIEAMLATRYDEVVDVQRVKAAFELNKAIVQLVKRTARETGVTEVEALGNIMEAVKEVKVA